MCQIFLWLILTRKLKFKKFGISFFWRENSKLYTFPYDFFSKSVKLLENFVYSGEFLKSLRKTGNVIRLFSAFQHLSKLLCSSSLLLLTPLKTLPLKDYFYFRSEEQLTVFYRGYCHFLEDCNFLWYWIASGVIYCQKVWKEIALFENHSKKSLGCTLDRVIQKLTFPSLLGLLKSR